MATSPEATDAAATESEVSALLARVPADLDGAAPLATLSALLAAPCGKSHAARSKREANVAVELRSVRALAERWREFLLPALAVARDEAARLDGSRPDGGGAAAPLDGELGALLDAESQQLVGVEAADGRPRAASDHRSKKKRRRDGPVAADGLPRRKFRVRLRLVGANVRPNSHASALYALLKLDSPTVLARDAAAAEAARVGDGPEVWDEEALLSSEYPPVDSTRGGSTTLLWKWIDRQPEFDDSVLDDRLFGRLERAVRGDFRPDDEAAREPFEDPAATVLAWCLGDGALADALEALPPDGDGDALDVFGEPATYAATDEEAAERSKAWHAEHPRPGSAKPGTAAALRNVKQPRRREEDLRARVAGALSDAALAPPLSEGAEMANEHLAAALGDAGLLDERAVAVERDRVAGRPTPPAADDVRAQEVRRILFLRGFPTISLLGPEARAPAAPRRPRERAARVRHGRRRRQGPPRVARRLSRFFLGDPVRRRGARGEEAPGRGGREGHRGLEQAPQEAVRAREAPQGRGQGPAEVVPALVVGCYEFAEEGVGQVVGRSALRESLRERLLPRLGAFVGKKKEREVKVHKGKAARTRRLFFKHPRCEATNNTR